MFVIKHCTKLSQFFASRHIENVSRFSQVTHVSTNLSSFNTDAIVHHISHVADPLVLDLTLGSGSTSRSILTSSKSARVIAVDCNSASQSVIGQLESDFPERFSGYVEKWSNIPEILADVGLKGCDAVIIDLGQSGETAEESSELDLRYDKSSDGLKASNLIQTLDVDNLKKMLKIYGGVLKAKTIASHLVERRFLMEEINSTSHLRHVLREIHNQDQFWEDRSDDIEGNIESVFLALRMFINDEINELYYAIEMSELVLEKDGLLVIKASTEHERNLAKKFVFRNVGSISGSQSEAGKMFRNNWQLVSSQNVDTLMFAKI